MAEIYYIIRPTEALRHVLNQYPKHSWGKTKIWALPVDIHDSFNHEYNLLKAKLVLLLSKLSWKTPNAVTARLRSELFGDPPHYSVKQFDKWWTLERTEGLAIDYVTIMNYASADDFRKLEKTNNQDVNEWLAGIVHHRTQLETYPLDIQDAYKKMFDYGTRFVMPADVNEVFRKIQDFHANEEKKRQEEDTSKHSDE